MSSTRQNIDIRHLPSYGFTEAAHYFKIPLGTLRSWVCGQYYPTGSGKKKSQPLVKLPERTKPLLSFMNLCEIHILDALRREHEISLQKVRKALNFIKKDFSSERPLIDEIFETDGIDLFVTKYGQLINITQYGQLEMKECIRAYLKRIEYDEKGLVAKIFPFTRKRQLDEPKIVVIDPFISFGRPVLVGTGIATSVIAERYKAGESIEDLAKDYDRQIYEIEEAIRCELQLKAAA